MSPSLASSPSKRAEEVPEADRQRYRAEVVSLGEKLRGADGGEQAVWEVYAGVEKLIALLKFRLDYETPGVFAKLPDASDPAKLLKDAQEYLSRSEEAISLGRLVESVETLRKARNNLRSFLVDKRRSGTKRGGRTRGSRAS